MLSYQHLYHAGNLADVHKHALLAWMLAYLAAKDKPLTYLESHAGRGLYDLGAPEALRTGEAAAGIGRLEAAFAPDHPYRQALDRVRAQHGPRAYPGSPMLAALLLRDSDTVHLAEQHPQEFAALAAAMLPWPVRVHRAVRPWRLVWARGARSVLELPVGTIDRTGTEPGDLIRFDPPPGA